MKVTNGFRVCFNIIRIYPGIGTAIAIEEASPVYLIMLLCVCNIMDVSLVVIF